VQSRRPALRTVACGLCLLTIAAACSSSHKSAGPSTTANPVTSTTDPNLTPNSIPYVVGQQIGLPNGWRVTVTKVQQRYAAPGLRSVPAGREYVAIDIRMENQGPASHAVNADRLFTLVDSLHKSHYVVAQPGHANGIDGDYPAGTTHSGRLLFLTPTGTNLGLILYGPRIGTQVSYFAIIPPTGAQQS
jgi:hypothetical protein